ncbi:MAG: helix-turn-helix transcriptional regulator [Sphingopyxis sp.]
MRVKGTDHEAVERMLAASGDIADYARLYPATPTRVVEIIEQVALAYAELGIDLIFEHPEGESVRIERLRSQYGLTLAEAVVALHIAGGGNMRNFAEQRKLSRHTARNQLQQVFDKTAVHSQAELVRLLKDF